MQLTLKGIMQAMFIHPVQIPSEPPLYNLVTVQMHWVFSLFLPLLNRRMRNRLFQYIDTSQNKVLESQLFPPLMSRQR